MPRNGYVVYHYLDNADTDKPTFIWYATDYDVAYQFCLGHELQYHLFVAPYNACNPYMVWED